MSNDDERLKELGIKVRELRAAKADPATIEPLIKEMKELQLKKAGDEANGSGAAKKFIVKTPKGTIDYTPADMAIRENVFSTITRIYRAHGAVTIDTPVFELKEILQGKYGEDSKLIYDLEDQGGEKCSLRYDLTVPFARYLAQNTDCKTPFKRYHIGKVYRRDQPAMTKGRMREFYQCDYDIAGQYEPMVPDAEVLRVMCEVLTALDIGYFTVKINHRKILDGIFEVCGVESAKFRTICSAVDKLDKLSWADVKKEMTEEKGLSVEIADKIGEFVLLKGQADLIDKLEKSTNLTNSKRAKEGLNDMRSLFKYLDIYNVTKHVSFDLSLARGLDYYTGVIYEAVLNGTGNKNDESAGVGSIAGGGRYDELVGMFAQSKNSNIPCVGFSIGVERIFSILKHKYAKTNSKPRHIATDVLVVAADGLLEERMKICAELWDAGIKADFIYKAKPKFIKQLEYCDKDEHQIPWTVIIGSTELTNNQIRIKNMRSKDDGNKEGELVKRSDMIAELSKRINPSVGNNY